MTEVIQFPYRGWVVKVAPESDGWTAYIHHPRMLDDGFVVIASKFSSAVDAVRVAMEWANYGTIESEIRKALEDEVESNRLTHAECARLRRCFRSRCFFPPRPMDA